MTPLPVAISPWGLSPRVRGNRQGPRSPGSRTGVYPRVYGGTAGQRATVWQGGIGLSPRVRGNLQPYGSTWNTLRSIPACTGEPWRMRPRRRARRVYPRVYGGTAALFLVEGVVVGSIPACTGEPRGATARLLRNQGSIPACTGEPPSIPGRLGWAWVYPRVYGGTPLRWSSPGGDPACTGEPGTTGRGLSPRVRGNPLLSRCSRSWAGLSPRVRGNRPASAGVYPRVRGTCRDAPFMSGLSPRVRGNRVGRRC